jgi:hypothetical protein
MTYADEAIAFNFKIATLAQTASLAMTERMFFCFWGKLERGYLSPF